MAEISYRPFGQRQAYRLILRRVAPAPGTELSLKGLAYSYYAFITDREGDTRSWRPTIASTLWSRT